MTQAKTGDTVNVHYTGRLDDGSVFDSSVGGEPLEFTLGANQVIPGFEQAVVGMELGETKTVKISCDDAYGPYNEGLVMDVDREQFPAHINPEVGQELRVRQGDNQVLRVTVTALSDDKVTLDANHPLAGHDLTFDIELVTIA